ncbi:uncharacterized protein LOC122016093 [Zingiber officinale]|uniref:uncharacterized protein LOC122016088 n=1 Tax=Zingiber officinale TaxID=94328 RepID=UPI001C4CCC9D|nr:uncharacterized protein LOC122016088 [Zingiber officinale]XP_042429214.1 uncharacterized protein LOC122016093 [Zingiber officinale]
MVSDPIADQLASSTFAAAYDRKVKLLCSYGGKIIPRAIDGSLRYAGGETRIITLRRDSSIAEVLRKVTETYGRPVLLRYQLPDEDLDSLVTVSTSEDLESMMEEYDKLTADRLNAKLRLFLFSPCEVGAIGADSFNPSFDPDQIGTRYIEAVNGLNSSMKRKKSTNFSSSRKSDAMAATVVVTTEGMGVKTVVHDGVVPSHACPTSTSSHDSFNWVSNEQHNKNMQPAIDSASEIELLTSNQPERPRTISNEKNKLSSGQFGFPSLEGCVPETYVNAQHALMRSSLAMGFPPPVNHFSLPAQTYAPVTPNDALHLENPNLVTAVKFSGDIKHQPVFLLPPLPSASLLSLNDSTMRLDDCTLCQRSLHHAHSEILVKKQGNKLNDIAPEANAILKSQHSEDLTSMQAPQLTDIGTLETETGTQTDNLVAAAPSNTSEISKTATETSLESEKTIISVSNVDLDRDLIPPVSVGMENNPQSSYIIEINLHKSCESNSLQTKADGPLSLDINPEKLIQPTMLEPCGASLVLPNSTVGDSLQQRMLLPELNVFLKYPVSQNFSNQSLIFDNAFVDNNNLVGNSDYETNRQPSHRTARTFSHGNCKPGISDSSNLLRPNGIPDVDTSKYLKPEQQPLIIVNTLNTGMQDQGDKLSVINPVSNPAVAPEANDDVLINQQTSAPMDAAYLQNFEPAYTSQIPIMSRIHGQYLYYPAAKDGPRGMCMNVDHSFSGNDINKNPIVNLSDEIPSLVSKNIFSVPAILQRDGDQHYTYCHPSNTDQLQQVVDFDSLVSNKEVQKDIGITSVLPPVSGDIPSEDSIAMDMHNKVCPLSSTVAVPAEDILCNLPIPPNIDSTTDLASFKVVHNKQEIQTSEESASAVLELQPCDMQVPALISLEAKQRTPCFDKECGTTENNKDKHDQIEMVKAKQSEKIKCTFHNRNGLGHLQIIKNSELEELKELESGTFGTVYHGKWRGSDVVIQRISDRVFAGKPSEQEHAKTNFWNEACKLVNLHHPNVVAFYGIVLDGPGGSIATVSEFVVNGSLRCALLKNEKLFDRRRCLLIAMDVAFGMEYLHSKNVIHFDLKSENLLVNLGDIERPICKIGYLLSKIKFKALVSSGMQGIVPWMAPELLRGKDAHYTEKVDVFSFGIVMWELITGDEPFKDMHYGAIIGGILEGTLRPPVPESCDAEWRSLMEQCWATDPELRPGFAEIAGRLRIMLLSFPQEG